MLDFLEVEETVGRFWHRWASGAASYPDHPEAAVSLESLRPMLGVFFRAGGGEAGVEVAAIARRGSAHRLSLPEGLRWLIHTCPELLGVRFRLWGAEPRLLTTGPRLSGEVAAAAGVLSRRIAGAAVRGFPANSGRG